MAVTRSSRDARSCWLLAASLFGAGCGDGGVTTTDGDGSVVGPGDATAEAEVSADAGADVVADIPPRDAAACASCELVSCAAQVSACQKDTECAAIVTCAEACNPATATKCTQTCLTADPAGASDFNALASCVDTSCATACAY